MSGIRDEIRRETMIGIAGRVVMSVKIGELADISGSASNPLRSIRCDQWMVVAFGRLLNVQAFI